MHTYGEFIKSTDNTHAFEQQQKQYNATKEMKWNHRNWEPKLH